MFPASTDEVRCSLTLHTFSTRSFLRKHVLPDIGRSGTFEQIHITKPHTAVPQSASKSKSSSSKKQEPTSVSAWVWRVTPPERLALQAKKVEAISRKSAPPDPLVYNAEKDVLTLAGAPSIEHLNVRRRRARVQKAQGERALVKEIAASRLVSAPPSAQESVAAAAA